MNKVGRIHFFLSEIFLEKIGREVILAIYYWLRKVLIEKKKKGPLRVERGGKKRERERVCVENKCYV